jgi:hypothetical protein
MVNDNYYDFTGDIIKKNRACTRKKRYITKEFAEKIKEKVARRTGKEIKVYHCLYCGQYHIARIGEDNEKTSSKKTE